MLHEPLKERARGRWVGILSAVGVPLKALKNKHGPCPVCGGKDRFRFDDKGGTGSFYCSHCGPGDGVELVKRLRNVQFKDAALLIEEHLGEAPLSRSGRCGPQTDGRKREEMIALWSRSRPIELSDHAGQYLHDRTGLVTFPSCLRFSPDERYVEAGSKPTWHPAMVAKVDPCDAAAAVGERAAIHRTYLSTFAKKADVAAPRKMMGTMPTGAAVRLMQHEGVLGIAEGIETALSASVLFNVPVWAALTAGLLQDWTPPPDASTIFVFGDNDVSNTGQAAAYALAQRLKASGLTVSVEIPQTTGCDWNDVHQRSLRAGA